MLGLLVAAYLLLLPLLTYFTFWHAEDPELDVVDAADLPEVTKNYFEESFDEYISEGYDYVATIDLKNEVEDMRGFVAFFANEDAQEVGLSNAIFAYIDNSWKLQLQYCEIQTDYSDGYYITTCNAPITGSFPKFGLSTIHPGLPIQQLRSAHQAFIEAEERGRRSVFRLHREFDGDCVAYIASDIRATLEHATKCGYLSLIGSNSSQPATESPYRPPQRPPLCQHV